jgi:hypothetical protein
MSKTEQQQQYAEEPMGGEAEYEMNWDEVGSLCPKGLFDFKVVDAKYQLSKSQKHMVVVRFAVEGAHDEANMESSKNKSVFENFLFTTSAGFRVKGFAKATGIELPPLINKDILEQWAASIHDVMVAGLVDYQDFNGEPKATIKKFITYGTATEDQPQEEEAPPPPARTNGTTAKGIRAAVNGAANGKVNGHANGAKASPPAKKTAIGQKAQARK